MLARLPLRSKLILVVSVPLVVILAFAGFGVSNRLDDLERQRQYGDLRVPNAALGDVQRALEHEGVLTAWLVASRGDASIAARIEPARADTDRAIKAVHASGRSLSSDDVSAPTRQAWNALDVDFDGLPSLRRQADEAAGLPAAFAERYTNMTRNAIDVSARLARDLEDRALSDRMLAIVSLRREQALVADEAMIVLPYLQTGASTQFEKWLSVVREQATASGAFLIAATDDARAAYGRAVGAASRDPFRTAVGNSPTDFPKSTITPTAYYSSWRDRQAGFTTAIAAAQRMVDSFAADLETDALRGVLAYGFGVAVLVIVVLGLGWVMVRSVNRSLHSLTDAARDVAENRLPNLVDTIQRGGEMGEVAAIQPLTVDSKDEIGALAQAFNTIQETTVRVAEQQAALLRKGIGDLYVNLARRNQSLVDRQIELLDVLEARTEDPDLLASLFELDHLATRMRRNAESLLVLSGAGQARQWTEAIPILDVVRAASGEIADFARVSFVGFDGDVAVTGNAVADVTHILAELLENATAFSPPGTPVVVAGMLAERRFVVSITDEGIGMDDQRLAAANALLQAPPPAGLALSRTLGLHVVAHLAARYGVRVQLRRSATNGVTAIVALPTTVLTRSVDGYAAPAPPLVSMPTRPPAEVVTSPVPGAPGTARSVAHGAPVGSPPTMAWPEPEVVPPAFDPAAAVPPVATPVEPRLVSRPASPAPPVGDALPRRAPGPSPVGDPLQGSLPQRDPGNHLSFRPTGDAKSPGSDGRRRPERVHDLLTRHLRGIRDGQDRSGSEAPDWVDAEERP